jgi:hypothetical protein
MGLAFPSEVLLLLAAFWGSMISLPPGPASLVTAGAYAALRLATLGRQPMFLQHLVGLHLRRLLHEGRFSAAARAASNSKFPHAAYVFRDVPHDSVSATPGAHGDPISTIAAHAARATQVAQATHTTQAA